MKKYFSYIYVILLFSNNLYAMEFNLAPSSFFIKGVNTSVKKGVNEEKILQRKSSKKNQPISTQKNNNYNIFISNELKESNLTEKKKLSYFPLLAEFPEINTAFDQALAEIKKSIIATYKAAQNLNTNASDFATKYGSLKQIRAQNIEALSALLAKHNVSLELTLNDTKIKLGNLMESKLLEFILLRPDKEVNFDCCSLVHYLNNVDRVPPKLKDINDPTSTTGSMNFAQWNIKSIDKLTALKVGDSLALVKSDRVTPIEKNGLPDTHNPLHWFIYIGEHEVNGKMTQLFISKMNNQGPVAITTLQELVRIYGGDYIIKAIPREGIQSRQAYYNVTTGA